MKCFVFGEEFHCESMGFGRWVTLREPVGVGIAGVVGVQNYASALRFSTKSVLSMEFAAFYLDEEDLISFRVTQPRLWIIRLLVTTASRTKR